MKKIAGTLMLLALWASLPAAAQKECSKADSAAAEKVTGQVFIVHGGMVQLLSGPRPDQRWDHEGGWTSEGLAETLGPVFESRTAGAGFGMSMGGG